MEIKIFGSTYYVEFTDNMDDYGITRIDKLLIRINSTYSLTVQRETLLHEILHIILDLRARYAVDSGRYVPDEDNRHHLIIEPIASALYHILYDNDNLLKFLFPG